ncbi:MAG: hypothetical protein AMS21_03945 [Gemmatimonas sp. SG8_38_2]|nr:MAG: hypothetical protein AMS21_03945 [Gemmatimonas sp. SG8_38_2]
MTNAGERRISALDGLALAIVLLAGLIYLPQPFAGDQALAVTIAAEMNHGEVLYRDVFLTESNQASMSFTSLAGSCSAFTRRAYTRSSYSTCSRFRSSSS